MGRRAKAGHELAVVSGGDDAQFLGMGLDELDAYLTRTNVARAVLNYLPWQLTAAVMKARGRSNTQISAEVNRSPNMVGLAFKAHPELLEWGIQQVVNPERMFTPMLPKAAKVFDEVLDLDPQDAATHKVRVDVARDVFDRAYGKPVQRTITDTRGNITIEFIDDDPSHEASQRNETAILGQLALATIIEPITVK